MATPVVPTRNYAFTPGPWHCGQGNGEGSIFADDGRMRLAEGGTTLWPICTMVNGWEEAEDEANAKLIASSPALAVALRRLLIQAEMTDDYEQQLGGTLKSACRQAREALAQAGVK